MNQFQNLISVQSQGGPPPFTRNKGEPCMRPCVQKNQSRAFAILLAAMFLLASSQFGWPTWAKNQACFHDIAPSVSINASNEAPEQFFEAALPPAEYQATALGSDRLPGKAFQNRFHPFSLIKSLNGRSPPIQFFT
jgi:hypothetical protein